MNCDEMGITKTNPLFVVMRKYFRLGEVEQLVMYLSLFLTNT